MKPIEHIKMVALIIGISCSLMFTIATMVVLFGHYIQWLTKVLS